MGCGEGESFNFNRRVSDPSVQKQSGRRKLFGPDSAIDGENCSTHRRGSDGIPTNAIASSEQLKVPPQPPSAPSPIFFDPRRPPEKVASFVLLDQSQTSPHLSVSSEIPPLPLTWVESGQVDDQPVISQVDTAWEFGLDLRMNQVVSHVDKVGRFRFERLDHT